VDELRAVGDWNLLYPAPRAQPSLTASHAVRVLTDGKTIDLADVLNDANCRKVGGCSAAAMDAITAERPWGANNPRWQPFAWGYLNDLVPTVTVKSRFYAMVMVADDPSECDDNPLVDGGAMVSCPRARRRILARASSPFEQAFGPFGSHRAVELTPKSPGGG
jgi:hypothetical protein